MRPALTRRAHEIWWTTLNHEDVHCKSMQRFRKWYKVLALPGAG